jgi:nucleoside permease NupC
MASAAAVLLVAFLLACGLVSGLIGGFIGERNGMERSRGFALGVVFGPVGWVLLALGDSKRLRSALFSDQERLL